METGNETVADIVKRLRNKDYYRGYMGTTNPLTDRMVGHILDSIESAHKREIAELRERLNNVTKACDAEEAKLPVGGNIETRLWLEGIIGRIRKAGEK